MKFRIYSDSWAWSWWGEGITGSKSFANFGEHFRSLSLVKIILERLGHEVVLRAIPGHGIKTSTDMLLHDIENYPFKENRTAKAFPSKREIWVHLISSPLRDIKNSNAPTIDFSSIDNYFTSHDSAITAHLQSVSDSMHQYFKFSELVTIIPIGGQIQLPFECFNAINNPHPDIKFGCEWILAFLENYKALRDDPNGHIFNGDVKKVFEDYFRAEPKKWAEKWAVNGDEGKRRQTQAMRVLLQDLNYVGQYFDQHSEIVLSKSHLELLEFFDDVHKAGWTILRPINFRTLYPDGGHLGWNGHVLFADWLLLTAERMGFIEN